MAKRKNKKDSNMKGLLIREILGGFQCIVEDCIICNFVKKTKLNLFQCNCVLA